MCFYFYKSWRNASGLRPRNVEKIHEFSLRYALFVHVVRSASRRRYATFSFVPTQKWVIGDKNDEKFNFPLTKSFFAKIYLN